MPRAPTAPSWSPYGDEAQARYVSGEPIYFYSRTGPFFELSNFAPFGFEADGKLWPTVEHYYQAHKFADTAFRERVRRTASAKEARALGQSRQAPIRPDWDTARQEVMLYALRLKFRRAELRALLLSTGDRELIEASPYDHFWGAGKDGTGRNRLGVLLMQVRSELQAKLV